MGQAKGRVVVCVSSVAAELKGLVTSSVVLSSVVPSLVVGGGAVVVTTVVGVSTVADVSAGEG